MKRERQAEKLHYREDQNQGQMDPRLGRRQTSLPFLASPSLPISWANHPLRQQQKSSLILLALATLPVALPPPITPAIISLVQNELLQLQPRQLFHLGASAGAGWLGPRGMPSWTAGGNGNGGGREGVAWSLGTHSPLLPGSHQSSSPTSPGVQTPWAPHAGLAHPVLLTESCPAPSTQSWLYPASGVLSGLRILVSPPPWQGPRL